MVGIEPQSVKRRKAKRDDPPPPAITKRKKSQADDEVKAIPSALAPASAPDVAPAPVPAAAAAAAAAPASAQAPAPLIEPTREVPGGGARKVTFVLDGATLESAKVGKGYELLNCDDHVSFLKRHGRDPAAYRPDIVHAALLSILDSPLNKAGHVGAIYVRTGKNVLFEVHPGTRLPRTLRRFSGLIVQLLQKLSIRATNGPDRLLRVVKGPVTRLLPPDAHRIGFSHSAGKVVRMRDHALELADDRPVVFVVGAFAHGHVDDSWVDEYLSISKYPLSAAYALGRITGAFEDKWGIV